MNTAYELQGIKHVYKDVVALKLDEYRIASECITALVGPNGSGKSTLMDIITFIKQPAQGSIKFFGSAIGRKDGATLRQQIGYVQQKPYLFNTTVFKNIELGLKLRKVDKTLRHKKTSEIIEEFGLGTLINRRAHELSGGEVQKVALARTMLLEPKMLIMDEPFNHLDDSFKKQLKVLLRANINKYKQTILFSTHDYLLAQNLADHVSKLVNGHMVPASAVNLFSGKVDATRNVFITDKLTIYIPESIHSGNKLFIEGSQLVLSNDELKSSMRNTFKGVIKVISEENGSLKVVIDAGEKFQATITKSALKELAVSEGDFVWVSFKSSAVNII